MRSSQVTLKQDTKTPQKGLSGGIGPSFPSGHKFGWAWTCAEVLLLAVCFGLFVGQPAPDVNETHYLAKAKHFWNPAYCPGDIFLSSSFSHRAFYVVTGWLTLFCSLETYAWIGRITTWVLLAAGWQRVCRQLFNAPMMSVVCGILFVVLNLCCHLAGEWVVGGFEAKGLAYAFVLFAIAKMLQSDWRWTWPLLGCASAFHVLVGGWATLAAGGCLIFSHTANINNTKASGGRQETFITTIGQQFGPLLCGLLIALIGIVPPLLAETGSLNTAAAHAIYVSQRVAHHVNFAAFPVAFIGRFLALILVGWFLGRWYQRACLGTPQQQRSIGLLMCFTTMTLVFAFCGLILSGMVEQGGAAEVFANRFLRFYCFRLADFAVPAFVALLTGVLLTRGLVGRTNTWYRICSAMVIGVIAVVSIALIQQRHADGRPNADMRTLLADEFRPQRTQQIYRNWRKVCRWIEENTPQDAVFITPAQQQTFKWYAGRNEICCWKDVPQDPDTMAQWRQRIATFVEPQRVSEAGIFVYTDAQISDLARQFGATHLLTQQQAVESIDPPTQLRQIYPEDPSQRVTWAVFKLDEDADDAAEIDQN